jgi:hypothetical protein
VKVDGDRITATLTDGVETSRLQTWIEIPPYGGTS